MKTIRRQQSLPGIHRIPTLGCLDPHLRSWVEKEAQIFNCRPSFVMNSLVSFVSGLPLQFGSYRQERQAKAHLRVVQGRKRA